MRVALYSRGLDHEQEAPLLILLEELAKHKVDVLVFRSLLSQYNLPSALLENVVPFDGYEDLDSGIDCFITLGGDGTILDATTIVREKRIPLLGINFGRLGFLANISKDELAVAVDAIVNRTFIPDKRSLIHLDASVPLFGDSPFALNEFAIHKRDTAPMIKIHTYLNGEFLNTFWADGLIVSTPTGSTGYSMSCTGPIVFPDSRNFVITPVAPHNLNVRSIVVADTSIISFEIESRVDQFICALDARREIVDKNIQLAVRKETFDANLIKLSENTFLSTLREKLTWGMDKRN
ncbi:NAD kinase [Parasediminibacterium sp. JCM 36343]|uniref:NAD kinase n=1 Tax=Parasediminibacterium sp. JCM 36343 TaxID=3374279 RepID=UPI00397B00EC